MNKPMIYKIMLGVEFCGLFFNTKCNKLSNKYVRKKISLVNNNLTHIPREKLKLKVEDLHSYYRWGFGFPKMGILSDPFFFYLSHVS